MEARNRIADVVKLRCNACQDFFRMICKPDWQQLLYNEANNKINNDLRFKEKYRVPYGKMRDYGISAFSIEDMDVTLISELVLSNFNGIISVQSKTRSALRQLKEDRNLTNHSGENEKPNELYLRGLLSLCDLRNFIITVDQNEDAIEDSKRLFYRQKYIPKIDKLMSLLDDERIELILPQKEIDNDISRILNSDNPEDEWLNTFDHYFKSYYNTQKYYDFIIRASDEGINKAHNYVALHYALEKQDFIEAERRLIMWYNSESEFSKGDVHTFLNIISIIISLNGEISPKIKEIIDSLRSKGHNIDETDGIYSLRKERKNNRSIIV